MWLLAAASSHATNLETPDLQIQPCGLRHTEHYDIAAIGASFVLYARQRRRQS
jgi:hypothetical protein